MKLKIFSVRDQKADAFITPFMLPTVDMAVREFSGCVRDASHQFGRFKEDFSLWEVAEFDVESGKVTALAEPKHLLSAITVDVPGKAVL